MYMYIVAKKKFFGFLHPLTDFRHK